MSDSPSIYNIAADVREGRRSAVEVCEETLDRIAAGDERVGAFLEVLGDEARAAAAQIDAERASGGSLGPLAGAPLAIKDNICTRVGHTTCASRMLSQYRSPYDASAIKRLLGAGAVIVGKTNLDEFAMGSSTENSAMQPTRNPWNLDCAPGGSSGGSAAAVAARLVPAALGSDTGGSIRLPASLCGVVGMKPTYGRVSRYGLVAYGSSLDQIGPVACDVRDAALLLGVIAGHDPHDSTSANEPVPAYVDALSDGALEARLAGLRIGVAQEYLGEGIHPEVQAAVEAALEVYRALGAEIVDVSLPHTKHCIAAYYLVATAEASSNLARYDGVHYGRRTPAPENVYDLYASSREEGFGPEVKRRVMLGAFALSAGYYDAYYNRALKVRRLIKQDFDKAFNAVDVIACPASPTPAFPLGAKLDDPLQMYMQDVFTVAANLAGIPGISIPGGMTSAGLPIGLQLLGPVFGETTLLQVARLFERQTDWHARVPPTAATA